MEINIKFDEKMIAEVANCVLDEYEYNGKTIREWADFIANPKTNADRIRSMSDEELAAFLLEATSNAIVVLGIGSNGKSKNAFDWYEWLKEEVRKRQPKNRKKEKNVLTANIITGITTRGKNG